MLYDLLTTVNKKKVQTIYLSKLNAKIKTLWHKVAQNFQQNNLRTNKI